MGVREIGCRGRVFHPKHQECNIRQHGAVVPAGIVSTTPNSTNSNNRAYNRPASPLFLTLKMAIRACNVAFLKTIGKVVSREVSIASKPYHSHTTPISWRYLRALGKARGHRSLNPTFIAITALPTHPPSAK